MNRSQAARQTGCRMDRLEMYNLLMKVAAKIREEKRKKEKSGK